MESQARDRGNLGAAGVPRRLYQCLTARPDASFELIDAILCADHAVTALIQFAERGHRGVMLDGGQVEFRFQTTSGGKAAH